MICLLPETIIKISGPGRKRGKFGFLALKETIRGVAKDRNSAYISIFHNWGPKAGATIYHPHYQIMAIPVDSSGCEPFT